MPALKALRIDDTGVASYERRVKGVQRYTENRGRAELCRGVQRYAEVCRGMQRCAEVCKGGAQSERRRTRRSCSGACTLCVQSHVRVYQMYALGVYRGMQRCAGICAEDPQLLTSVLHLCSKSFSKRSRVRSFFSEKVGVL